MSFSTDIARFIKKCDNNVDYVVSYTVNKVGEDMIMRNPVGNPNLWKTKYPPKGYVGGRSRANWRFGIDQPDLTTDNTIDASGKASLSRIPKQIAAGRVYYVTNSLPYMHRLEFGHSTQAPGGMVRLAVMRFMSFINQAVSEVK